LLVEFAAHLPSARLRGGEGGGIAISGCRTRYDGAKTERAKWHVRVHLDEAQGGDGLGGHGLRLCAVRVVVGEGRGVIVPEDAAADNGMAVRLGAILWEEGRIEK
jgi:hypothetical protein